MTGLKGKPIANHKKNESNALIAGLVFRLTPKETDAIKRIAQSRPAMSSLTSDDEYLAIIKIVKKLPSHNSVIQCLANLSTFFNQLNSDGAFKKIIGIIKSANLTDALAIELVKAQYKQNHVGSSRTNELIKQLDNRSKLSELPEKAFNQLMNYRVKMLKLEKTDASIFMKIEKNQTLTEAEKMQLHQQLASNQQSITDLPKKAQAVIKAQDVATHAGVTAFLTKTKDVRFSQAIANDMVSYIKLLNDIENNKQPDNAMLKKLDLLHDELKRHNKLGALPNRSQAFLENYQTEQYLKQKAPQNAQ
ncbi:MAG: hypothetical protein K0U39_05965, partial [Alphaproteobacteria bacterium]|nr:hypothetical protein [Alphaproteobacteria bacterium]